MEVILKYSELCITPLPPMSNKRRSLLSGVVKVPPSLNRPRHIARDQSLHREMES